jgi:membrane-associated phospholipid phosphatase
MSFWHLITNLGDSAVMLPSAVIIGLWLWFTASRAVSLRWYASFATACSLVALSKIAFFGWGVGIRALDFTGFSGHSMLGATVLPVLFWLLLQPSGWLARVAPLVGAVMAILVAWSRVHLGYHSPSEAITGTTIGLSAAAFFLYRAPFSAQRARSHRYALACSLAAPLVILHGVHAPTHGIIQKIGAFAAGNSQPFTRKDLHQRNELPDGQRLKDQDV